MMKHNTMPYLKFKASLVRLLEHKTRCISCGILCSMGFYEIQQHINKIKNRNTIDMTGANIELIA